VLNLDFEGFHREKLPVHEAGIHEMVHRKKIGGIIVLDESLAWDFGFAASVFFCWGVPCAHCMCFYNTIQSLGMCFSVKSNPSVQCAHFTPPIEVYRGSRNKRKVHSGFTGAVAVKKLVVVCKSMSDVVDVVSSLTFRPKISFFWDQ
jgi:hypothetical protein